MKTHTIEFCTNDEWLVVFGPYDENDESDSSEPSPDACELIQAEIKAVERVRGVELVSGRDGRCLCHGWNGAHFAWRYRQFGAMEHLPGKLRRALEDAIDAAETEAKP